MKPNIWLVLTISIFLVLSGCDSTMMKKSIGGDIRLVILDHGDPVRIMDMGDGRRAYQFRYGGGTYVLPEKTKVTGSITGVGNSAVYSGKKTKSGGQVVSSPGCLLTYFAKKDEAKNAWIVVGIRVPKQLVC